MGFQHREHASVAVHRPVEQQPHPVTRPHTPAYKEARQLVGPRVQLRITQRDIPGIDRKMIAAALPPQPVATALEQVLQTLALPPPD